MIQKAGEGVVVYLRQEGRGIGLINKLKAYSLQDTGLDTVEANERLGFPADLRNYGVGAQILSDLGVHRLRLITNNPRKIAGLGGYGLQVEDRVPLVMDASAFNAAYLQAKRTKLGHLMETGPSCPISPLAVVGWQGALDNDHPQALVQELQGWAEARGLQVERDDDARPRALLNNPEVLVRITGIEGEQLDSERLVACLERLAQWNGTRSVGLLLAPDGQRGAHPPADLTAEARPLAELGSGAARGLLLDAEALLVWS